MLGRENPPLVVILLSVTSHLLDVVGGVEILWSSWLVPLGLDTTDKIDFSGH